MRAYLCVNEMVMGGKIDPPPSGWSLWGRSLCLSLIAIWVTVPDHPQARPAPAAVPLVLSAPSISTVIIAPSWQLPVLFVCSWVDVLEWRWEHAYTPVSSTGWRTARLMHGQARVNQFKIRLIPNFYFFFLKNKIFVFIYEGVCVCVNICCECVHARARMCVCMCLQRLIGEDIGSPVVIAITHCCEAPSVDFRNRTLPCEFSNKCS